MHSFDPVLVGAGSAREEAIGFPAIIAHTALCPFAGRDRSHRGAVGTPFLFETT